MEEFDVKKALLDMGEDTLKSLISNVLKPYAASYILLSDNKWDDTILPFLDDIERGLLSLTDKIDGEVG